LWTYSEWNDFLCQNLFPADFGDTSVYVVFDEDLSEIASSELGVLPETALKNFSNQVRANLRIHREGHGIFEYYATLCREWKANARKAKFVQEVTVPPTIGLLALLSEAASGSSGEIVSSRSFYKSLTRLIGLNPDNADDVNKTTESYRRHILDLWEPVQLWTKIHNFQRGKCSVFQATNDRYVGLTISQVLLKASDLSKLPSFFRSYSLSPSDSESREKVQVALRDWTTDPSSNASAHLRTLWTNEAVRERIVDLISDELNVWDGGQSISTTTINLNIDLFVRRFPNIRFTPLLRIDGVEGNEGAEGTIAVDGSIVPVHFGRDFAGDLVMDENVTENIALSDLLFKSVSINLDELPSVKRAPSRIVLFVLDEMSNQYRLASRAPLLTSTAIVVKGHDIASCRQFIRSSAAEGWSEHEFEPVNSEKVVMFFNVFLKSNRNSHSEDWLVRILPTESAEIRFEGGLMLSHKRYLLNRPPRVSCISEETQQVTIELQRMSESGATSANHCIRQDSEGVWRFLLDDLKEGHFTLTLKGKSGRKLRSASIQFVSSDSDVILENNIHRIVHPLDQDLPWQLFAGSRNLDSSTGFIEGAYISGSLHDSSVVKDATAIITRAYWTDAERIKAKIAAGEHFSDVSVADWDNALEALICLKEGPIRQIASISKQVLTGNNVDGKDFWKTCYDTANIEVQLDASVRPSWWNMVPAQIIQVSSGEWVLSGGWTRSQVATLSQNGALLRVKPENGQPSRRYLPARDAKSVQKFLDDCGITANIITDAGYELLRVLPRFQDLVESLPSSAIPGSDFIHYYDPVKLHWKKTESIEKPGAYRLTTRSRRLYAIVTPASFVHWRCFISDFDTAKHAAAVLEGRPLMAYAERSQKLTGPEHVKLPILYSRAASLCSGRAPYQFHNSWTVYDDVPKRFAELLFEKFKWIED
jgi:hypothetical protein